MAETLSKIIIHTDGGCLGNPGVGGWAVVMEFNGLRKELSGGALATTNNRMELSAAISALSALKRPCQIDLHTDSQYVRNGITQWLAGWKKNGWKTSTKEPVKNEDLWRALDAAAAIHQINWCWVKGHAGNDGNERCDRLAGEVMKKIVKETSRDDLAKALHTFHRMQAG